MGVGGVVLVVVGCIGSFLEHAGDRDIVIRSEKVRFDSACLGLVSEMRKSRAVFIYERCSAKCKKLLLGSSCLDTIILSYYFFIYSINQSLQRGAALILTLN